MTHHPSRRQFFKHSGAVSVAAVMGDLALTAIGAHPATAMAPSALLELSATQVVQDIRSGKLKAEAYMAAMIAQAKAMSGLNAMIYLNEEKAMSQARQVDADRAAGKPLGALAGLPIVVKDNINTQDMKTTGGTPALRHFQPRHNAPSLQKLIDAGAIVLGKSNLHEWAFGITSTNFTLGTDPSGAATRPCKNPYDTSRIPGGSSGGTAVAIAARFAPAGLGTDTGGSTRVPASFCGVAGFRPSVGDGEGKGRRYPDTLNDALPISTTRDTLGPMARSVADLALLDAVITGTSLPVAASLKGLRVGRPASFWADLDDSVRAVAEAATRQLAQAGVVFVDADLTGVMALNGEISFPIALHEPVHAIPAYLNANQAPVKTVKEVSDQLLSPDVKGAFGAIQGPFSEAAFHETYKTLLATQRPALQKRYKEYFAAHGVACVLFPTTLLTAPKIDVTHGSKSLSYTVNGVEQKDKDTFATCIRNTDPCTNAGIPSLSIPAGQTPAGLPVGMQIDGPLGSDSQLLAIGMAIEKVWGPLQPPAR